MTHPPVQRPKSKLLIACSLEGFERRSIKQRGHFATGLAKRKEKTATIQSSSTSGLPHPIKIQLRKSPLIAC
jgi:hypothetical protein